MNIISGKEKGALSYILRRESHVLLKFSMKQTLSEVENSCVEKKSSRRTLAAQRRPVLNGMADRGERLRGDW